MMGWFRPREKRRGECEGVAVRATGRSREAPADSQGTAPGGLVPADPESLTSLADLREREVGVLVRLELPADVALRLMELGFLPGTVVETSHVAPGGDPKVFRVDGTEIALRAETARHVLVRRRG